MGLLVSDELKRGDLFRAEKLYDADFSGLAPIGAVGGEGDVRAAEGEVLGSGEWRLTSEDVIVGFEDEDGESGGGDHHGGDLAQVEVDNGAEFEGEVGQTVVGHVCEEVEVANDWKRRRRRWSFDGRGGQLFLPW